MSIATVLDPAGRRDLVLGPLPAGSTPLPLRRLPLPVLEPRASRLGDPRHTEDVPAVSAMQGVLDLAPPAAPSAFVPAARTALVPTARADDPHVEPIPVQHWAARFVQAAVEATGGIRPTAQLVRWATPDVQTLIERRAGLSLRVARRPGGAAAAGNRGRGRVLVRRVLCSQVGPGIYEASAVVQDQGRTRAVALRVERFEDRWHATALELG